MQGNEDWCHIVLFLLVEDVLRGYVTCMFVYIYVRLK